MWLKLGHDLKFLPSPLCNSVKAHALFQTLTSIYERAPFTKPNFHRGHDGESVIAEVTISG